MVTYIIIFVLLLIAELVYFRIADKCNIIDKPNERSSHSSIVLRGGWHHLPDRGLGMEWILWIPLSLVPGWFDIDCGYQLCG